MPELRCPNCGKNNPDVLDVCQFCQTPLKPESVLRIGQTPTKKNTGDLEGVLPEWLRDVRQQAKASAEEEEAAQAASKPQKNEPPDLLAGLASQAGSADDDEIPDWLASINPGAKPKPAAPSSSTPAPETDFFAQFNQSESKAVNEPAHQDVPSWAGNAADQPPASEKKDELSEWFSQAAEQPEEIVEFDPNQQQSDRGWASGFDSPLSSQQEPAPKEEEDLSWLRNLEEVAKQTGDLKTPRQDMDWTADFEMPSTPSQPSASQDDLSWLNNLGGIDEPLQQPPGQPPTSQDDLSWLNRFGETQTSQPPEAAAEKPASQEDLSWLNSIGAASESSEPAQPFSAPAPDVDPAKSFSQEDLSWLNDLGKTAEPSQPVDAAQAIPPLPQERPDWLRDLGGQSEPLSTPPFVDTGSLKPRQTAPLGKQEETEPDWLKSAAEAPSMPAPGDVSMDWFTRKDQPLDSAPSARTSQDKPLEEPAPASSTPQPSPFSDFFGTPSEPSPLSNQDVDSLFSAEMPDWLSHPDTAVDESAALPTKAPSVENEESLTPVNLPSWVQAMRPVEAVISETTPGIDDQPEEKEGPLAGLRGVIPGAPIGSSRRPKAVSLKLQATDEQQASAALLEQILGSETSPRALITSSFVASQQILRWALTGLFLVVLGAMIGLRSQTMPISANLPVEGSSVSNAVMGIPAGSNVLVVIDYEPALSGEMEAIGGPVLDQMVSLSHPNLSFLSTSPNGSALVERLLANTKISEQYHNLGFLPGGAAGVLGFVESPGEVIPASDVESLSEYAALILMTDHAESGRVWVEQLQALRGKQTDPALTNQPLLVVASAQAGPLLQPYVSSRQITGMVSGLSEAARYEFVNDSRPGIVRSYWDTFGIGLTMAVALIILGSLWSLFTGIRARRAEAEQG